ncbi:MAG TPA: radical SAM protein, partial [Terriglobia bacterium]|nr:radical SAM protein [Terriglobia bacterium]
KETSVSLSVADREVYAFDLEGKPLSFWMDAQTFIYTLDCRVIKKWRDSESGQKQIQPADPSERERTLERARSRLAELQTALQRGTLRFVRSDDSATDPHGLIESWLAKFLAWDTVRFEKQKLAFASVYSPVTILPPDQYLTLVLQVTLGCHWNRCTFCDFYRTVHFHIRSMEEFERHIHAVKRFFGDAIRLRRSIFLGDANALVLPQSRLLRVFDQINQEFSFADSPSAPLRDGPIFQGINSFLDVFAGERKSEMDFRDLKARRLRRVYLGVETGFDPLLAFLNKPANSAQALELVARLKSTGLSLGLIVLIGPGGDLFSDAHVEQTAALIRRMPLGPEDLIYLSPLHTSSDSEYARRAKQARIRALTSLEIEEQTRRMRASLTSTQPPGPRLARYDIREFVY